MYELVLHVHSIYSNRFLSFACSFRVIYASHDEKIHWHIAETNFQMKIMHIFWIFVQAETRWRKVDASRPRKCYIVYLLTSAWSVFKESTNEGWHEIWWEIAPTEVRLQMFLCIALQHFYLFKCFAINVSICWLSLIQIDNKWS